MKQPAHPQTSDERRLAVAGHHFDIDQFDKVIETLAQTSGGLLENVRFWWLLGWSHYKLRNMGEARRCAGRGLALEPSAVGPRLTLFHCERRAGDVVSAETIITALLNEQPENFQFHLTYGHFLTQVGRLDEAEQAFHRSQQLNADDQAVKILLSNLALARGDTKQAFQESKKALAQNPDDRLAHQMHGAILLQSGDTESAEKHLITAIGLGADSASVVKAARQARERSEARKLLLMSFLGLCSLVGLYFLRREQHVAALIVIVTGFAVAVLGTWLLGRSIRRKRGD